MENAKTTINKFKYIPKSQAEELILQVESTEASKSGTNSKAFIVGDYVILKTTNIPLGKGEDDFAQTPFDRVIEKLKDLSGSGVNAVPVLGYQFEVPEKTGRELYGRGYIFQPVAPGEELWDRKKMPIYDGSPEKKDYILKRLRLLSSVPQKHYDKWISDFAAILDAGIMVDPKCSNFFYDKNYGFSFIDLNFERECNDKVFELVRYGLNPCLGDGLLGKEFFTASELDEIKTKNLEIFIKVVNALLSFGITAEEIRDNILGKTISLGTINPMQLFGVPSDLTNILKELN